MLLNLKVVLEKQLEERWVQESNLHFLAKSDHPANLIESKSFGYSNHWFVDLNYL